VKDGRWLTEVSWRAYGRELGTRVSTALQRRRLALTGWAGERESCRESFVGLCRHSRVCHEGKMVWHGANLNLWFGFVCDMLGAEGCIAMLLHIGELMHEWNRKDS
jgi:hypothetical protein